MGVESRRKTILAVVIFVIIGALTAREYPVAGLWVILCGIAAYLVQGAVSLVGERRSGKWGGDQKTRLVFLLLVLSVSVSALATGRVWWFMLLAVLGVDYLVAGRKPDIPRT